MKRRELHIVEVSVEGAFWGVLEWAVSDGYTIYKKEDDIFFLRDARWNFLAFCRRDSTVMVSLSNYHACEALADKVESIARKCKWADAVEVVQ